MDRTAERSVEQLPPREVAIREFNSLRGRLCSLIESVGLPHKQERAIVTMIKHLSFQNQSVVAQLLDELDDGRLFTVVDNKLKIDR